MQRFTVTGTGNARRPWSVRDNQTGKWVKGRFSRLGMALRKAMRLNEANK